MDSTHRNRFIHQLLVLALSIAVTATLAAGGVFTEAFATLGQGGFALAFVLGFFFVSIFTVAPAGAALYALAGDHNPYAVALIASAGAVVGDYLLFHFIRDSFFANLKEAIGLGGRRKIEHVFHSQRFHWFFVIAGAIIIASPFPDELGLALLGVSRLSAAKFVPLAFALDFVGIVFITLAGAR